jgi:ribosomal protein S18 acetylase RimI-like enzyme
MTIRVATAEDLAAIAGIQGLSPEAAQWEVESYLSYDCVVAIDTRVLGFLVTRQTAPGEREILNLAVDPAQRGRGVARALLQVELRREKTVWFLEVRESNKEALELYRKAGFRVAGRREFYYRNPVEAGIVMKIDS